MEILILIKVRAGMIDSAIAKTHGWLHSYATWTAENPGKAVGLAALKCATLTGVVILYQQYQDQYGEQSHSRKHTSNGTRVAEDIGLSTVGIVATIAASKLYRKHPNWHPKGKEGLADEPDGAKREDEVKPTHATSREARDLAEQVKQVYASGTGPRESCKDGAIGANRSPVVL